MDDELSGQMALWLQEIESVDWWGPTFQAIYENGVQDEFMERLQQRIEEHDAEIEKMCNHHYQGFIASVKHLLHVKTDATQLKSDVVKIDSDLRESAGSSVTHANELVKARRVEKNIAATIESLSNCLPVLQTFSKLSRQMKERRYHPALKTLEQLEQTYLPRITHHRFAKKIQDQIPKLRSKIKEASMRELKDFLENIRKYSPKIGELAMRHTAEKSNLDPSIVSAEIKKRLVMAPQPNPFTGEVDYEGQSESTHEAEADLSAQDLVDFSPVYKCLHIYSVLGEREEFEKYYRKQRRQQATLTLQPPSNMHESIDGYRVFFHGIVGFFVCEDHILNTGNGLITRGHLDEVWSNASGRIFSTLQTHSAYCTEAGFMLKIKNLMLLFSNTLQGYGFAVEKLYALLHELRDHYNEVLMQSWVKRFRDIFDSDNYHPVQINTPAEYDKILQAIPYESSSLEEAPFPKCFPFSDMVIRVYTEVKNFILGCVKFSEDLNLSPAEIDETVRKSTNILLTRTLSGCLSSLIRRDNLSLLQLIQIDINTYHLENTNIHLEKYISDITDTSSEANHIARLQGGSIFKDIRSEAEEEIHNKLESKIDEFLELANYNWLMSELLGMASPWLMDLIAFLNSVFLQFTNLPVKLAQRTCMSACQHLARALMDMLMDENVKGISHGVLEQIDLDLIQCEMFAAKEPIKGLEEGILVMCFSDLRQLLDLFNSWDWSTYFADYGQESAKYSRVRPQTALSLLDKLKEAEKKNVFSSIMNKKNRDKNRLFDTVYKQLQGLTPAASNNTISKDG